MKLYSYPKSTTSYRVRAVLNLKGIEHEIVHVDLLEGDQLKDEFRLLNPSKGVPALVLDDGTVMTQSLAIIEYLDTIHPSVPMLPSDPLMRSRMASLALIVATDIHPVNNLRVVGQLKSRFNASAEQCHAWMQHWIIEGFTAIETLSLIHI